MHNGDGEMLGRQRGQNQARRDAHLAPRLEQASQPTCARVATPPAGTQTHTALLLPGLESSWEKVTCLYTMNTEHFRAQRLRASALDSDGLSHIPPSDRRDSGQQFLYLEGPCVLPCEMGEPRRVTHQVPQGLNDSGAGAQCLVGT